MTGLADVVNGLASRIERIEGLRVYPFAPGSFPLPAVLILAPTIADYRADLGLGGFEADVDLAVLVPAVLDRQQLDLYAYLDRTGERSIFEAIESDRSLGFSDVDAYVTSARPLGLQEVASYQAYGANLTTHISLGG